MSWWSLVTFIFNRCFVLTCIFSKKLLLKDYMCLKIYFWLFLRLQVVRNGVGNRLFIEGLGSQCFMVESLFFIGGHLMITYSD